MGHDRRTQITRAVEMARINRVVLALNFFNWISPLVLLEVRPNRSGRLFAGSSPTP
jgi:hypothetical protein